MCTNNVTDMYKVDSSVPGDTNGMLEYSGILYLRMWLFCLFHQQIGV